MSAFFDSILFFVNLAFNLLFFGFFISGGAAVSLQLIKNAKPRLRYVIALAAFLFAALVPLAVTLNGSFSLDKFIEIKQSGDENFSAENFRDQLFVTAPEIALPAAKSGREKTANDLLNYFTAAVAGSFAGKIFLGFWILGTLGFIARDTRALRKLKKMRRRWRKATASERNEMTVPDEISLYFGEESPATIGFFRPAIVLPEHFPDDLTPAAKRFIVRHELAHARWRDPLVNSVLRLLRALFWISPALWVLARTIAAERESAADHAAVINGAARESEFKATALDYAATLVSVARHFNSAARRGSLSANSIGLSGVSSLENRVRRLLTQTPEPFGLRTFLVLVIFTGCLPGLLFMPVAFQAKQTDAGDKAVINNDQNPEKPPKNDDLKNLPLPTGQNNAPPLIESDKNKEAKIMADGLKENENQPPEFSNKRKESVEIPRLIFARSNQAGTINENFADAAAAREELMKKLSREDAKNSELRQKVNDLSDKLQALDDAGRNTGNDLTRMRQKADADADEKMMRKRSVTNPSQNTNVKRNTN